MKFFAFVLSAILCAGVPAVTVAADPAATAPDSAALVAFKKDIRQKYDMKEKAFAAHDAETILTRFYAEDAVSVGAGFVPKHKKWGGRCSM